MGFISGFLGAWVRIEVSHPLTAFVCHTLHPHPKKKMEREKNEVLSREGGAFSSGACTRQGCSFGLPSDLLSTLGKLLHFHFCIFGKSYARIILNTYNEIMRVNEYF